MVGEPGATGSRSTGVAMKKRKRGITIRFGPLGLSLLAAGITAVGLAAVSLADSGSGGSSGDTSGVRTFEMPAPGGGVGAVSIAGPNLSGADRQKMEDFRKCMEDNGAPGPPDPGDFDPSNPPKPPSAADQEKLQKAWEACKDKLPDAMQKGPPRIGTCGPPPGAPGQSSEPGNQENKDQSNSSSGTGSSGTAS
jgi:hypothetical protein